MNQFLRSKPMKNFLLLLDGPKGTGKSTIASLLTAALGSVVVLSLDVIRRDLPGAQATTEWNKIAFQIILDQATEALSYKKNVIIDCGLTEERFETLKKLSQNSGVSLRAYAFIAPYDVLLHRVKERDKKNGKITDESRFRDTYNIVQSKTFGALTILNTHDKSPQEIANIIISELE